MDFSRLPDNVFLQIFQYLPMEDCARLGRVNKSFHRMSQLAISRTKFIDLNDDHFWYLSADQLAVILDLCSPNLEKITFPHYTTPVQWATTLANYECPRLIHINLANIPIDYGVFEQLIRNNSNLENLNLNKPFLGFPNVTSNNLKKLSLTGVNDVTLQSMTGRIPNLNELFLLKANVTANVLDEFFASSQQIQRVFLHLVPNQIVFDESLVSFWNLPLTSLTILQYGYTGGHVDLRKVAISFPHLQSIFVSSHSVRGIRALAGCKQLQTIRLPYSVSSDTLIALLRGCPQLDFIHIYDIYDVDTPDEAAVVLGSLSGIAKRDIKILFRRNDQIESIWESEAVEEAIKNLKENEGFEVNIDIFRDRL